MKEFWTLVSFEYRKILGKRSVKIALLLTLFLSVFSIWGTLMGSYYIEGELFESNAEAMKKDRAYARELSGRILDDKLLMEAADAYQTIPDSAAVYQSTEEYQKNARKYSSIYSLARQVYDTPNVRFGAPEMGTLDPARAEQFYEIRELCMTEQIENAPISENAKEVMMQYSAEVKEPWIFSYSDGYTRFMTIMATSGVMAAFVMAICLAPLFAGEYSNHTDQLLLSARYGKGKLIKAKFFTGFSMTGIVTLLITLQSYVQSMLTFGFDGGNANVQIYDALFPYPLTLKQAALLQSICVFFACMCMSALTMFFSSRMKSAFGVIILSVLLLCVPMFVKVSAYPLLGYLLFHLMPANMMQYDYIFSMIPYEIAGVVIPPYVMMPVAALCLCIILIPFAYRGFKHHQVVS
ncbi:ABC transporter permease [Mediterraneibacter glycyrrhizinilyticus]|uniref:ABC transporter permease n=1 Tax=Mediterraneibacter glycyrrhizinilyticus TaxID=342942 RepID=UPI0006D1B043